MANFPNSPILINMHIQPFRPVVHSRHVILPHHPVVSREILLRERRAAVGLGQGFAEEFICPGLRVAVCGWVEGGGDERHRGFGGGWGFGLVGWVGR